MNVKCKKYKNLPRQKLVRENFRDTETTIGYIRQNKHRRQSMYFSFTNLQVQLITELLTKNFNPFSSTMPHT